jgi:uncharacterized membrane protein YgdD (TMEM256/DUF423 family)
MWTLWFGVGAWLSGLAVCIGAFGAHALKGKLTPDDAAIFDTASKYLGHQSMGVICLALLMSRLDSLSLKIAAPMMTTGILVFSGSLFALVWSGQRWLGAITPIGGALLILAWTLAGWAAISARWF